MNQLYRGGDEKMVKPITVWEGLDEKEFKSLQNIREQTERIYALLIGPKLVSQSLCKERLKGVGDKDAKILDNYQIDVDELWRSVRIVKGAVRRASEKFGVEYDKEEWGDCFGLLEREIKTQYGEVLKSVREGRLDEAIFYTHRVKVDIDELKKMKLPPASANSVAELEKGYAKLFDEVGKLQGMIEEAENVFPKRENYAQSRSEK